MEYCSLNNSVGIWFYSLATKRFLYLLRTDEKNPNTWGLPGGKAEHNESLLVALTRECTEELGAMPEYSKLIPIEQFTSKDGHFSYHTFFCCVEDEFQPELNYEHRGYCWVDATTWPRPLHPGLWNTVNFDAIQHKVQAICESIHPISA